MYLDAFYFRDFVENLNFFLNLGDVKSMIGLILINEDLFMWTIIGKRKQIA